LKNRHGFTLIELLIVLVILGVLAGLTIPRLTGRTEKAKIKAAQSDIKGGLALALDLYESEVGHYPKLLEQLIDNGEKSDAWDGPYIKSGLPKDPWQRSYVYKFSGEHNKKGYDLYSLGPDGTAGTEDDIKNWQDK